MWSNFSRLIIWVSFKTSIILFSEDEISDLGLPQLKIEMLTLLSSYFKIASYYFYKKFIFSTSLIVFWINLTYSSSKDSWLFLGELSSLSSVSANFLFIFFLNSIWLSLAGKKCSLMACKDHLFLGLIWNTLKKNCLKVSICSV